MTDSDPDQQQGDPELGDKGTKALQAERRRAEAAERQMKQVQAQLDSANTRIGELESSAQQLASDITARDVQIVRLNVGIEKGLPRPLIDRLQGEDAETFASDADQLLSMFPPALPAGGSPRPDPSQGSRIPAATTPRDSFKAAMGEAFS